LLIRGGVRIGDHGEQFEIEGGLAEPDAAAGIVPSKRCSPDQVLT
jgi:hypothetical protein